MIHNCAKILPRAGVEPKAQCPSEWGPQGPRDPWPGGRGPLGFALKFEAGSPPGDPETTPSGSLSLFMYTPGVEIRHIEVATQGTLPHVLKKLPHDGTSLLTLIQLSYL